MRGACWLPRARGLALLAAVALAAPSDGALAAATRIWVSDSASDFSSGEARGVSDRIQAYALYTDPPLGRVGMTETEAQHSGRTILVGKRPMSRVGRAIEKGETTGLMKVVVDANSREILGAAVLGTGGDEVIHCVLDTMYAKAPYTVLQRAMHVHPTVAELIPTILQELAPPAS